MFPARLPLATNHPSSLGDAEKVAELSPELLNLDTFSNAEAPSNAVAPGDAAAPSNVEAPGDAVAPGDAEAPSDAAAPSSADRGVVPQGRAFSDAGVQSAAASERSVLPEPPSLLSFADFTLVCCRYTACHVCSLATDKLFFPEH